MFQMMWMVMVMGTLFVLTTEVIGQNVSMSTTSTINCYQCNSNSRNEENCATTNGTLLKPYIRSCVSPRDGAHKGAKAVGCRKVLQEVGDEEWTIRECAFSGDNKVDGVKRTGNKGIRLFYYQCDNNPNMTEPCNHVNAMTTSSLLVLLVGVMLTRL